MHVVLHLNTTNFKIMKPLITCFLLFFVFTLHAQKRVNPVIKNYGGIYEIPKAAVVADGEIEYKIVIDVVTGAENSNDVAWGLNGIHLKIP